MTADDGWDQMIRGLREGDSQAARAFFAQYGNALQRLADKHLPAGLRRRVGPEDVAQSACRTFLRRAGGGEFQLADSEALWRLLCAITLTKVREQTRFHLRKKRGLNQETAADPDLSGSGQVEAADPNPTPAHAAEFADQFERLLGLLDDEGRQVVDLKLQEYTNEQVAERLGCSERTVRRTLKRVQAELARSFGEA